MNSDTLVKDGRNKNGLQMFRCIICGHRSSWYKREHGHTKLFERLKEEAEADKVEAEKEPVDSAGDEADLMSR